MSAPIQDDLTDKPISRQRKYQLRRERKKRCRLCGKPAARRHLCIDHLKQQDLAYQRRNLI